MTCDRCHAQNRAGVSFCEDCGARLDPSCPNCGVPLVQSRKFCGHCGVLLLIRPPERFRSIRQYTPEYLAEKILHSRNLVEGERKRVTVLFADIKGSMELLADRDPEEAQTILDPVIELMMESVHRYEGTVNQVLGDGVMALFGAPLAHEDHAVRACYAALAMQEMLRRYTEEVRRSRGVEIQARVGLNSGEVVVRSITNDLAMDYSAVGQTTHLAARMEQLAIPGTIRITAETLHLAEGFVSVHPIGPIPVKGMPELVEVFELIGAVPLRRRWQARASRGLTRFVGRERELDVLRQALAGARNGHGQIVAIVGEAGIGKSRLVWEFTHSCWVEPSLLLETGAVSYAKAQAYLPVRDLLKGYFQIDERDNARAIREKVTGKLLTLDRSLEPSLPAFLNLLDVGTEDRTWNALHPTQLRERTLDAIKRLLLREAQVQPVCLVFEDLHWTDTETHALLNSLVDSLPAARLLLIVNYRPDFQHGWASKNSYQQVRLDSLPIPSAEALLESLLGDDPDLAPLKRLLISTTDGNPFFLEECVRTLIETNVLVREDGVFRLRRFPAMIQVPPSVEAVLAARIDRLQPEEKRLLECAAVIGKNVPFRLLQAVTDSPEDVLRRHLARLQAAEFLYETSLFPDLEYAFTHSLTHDVAYGSLLQERRRLLHARIVEAMEAVGVDQALDSCASLAHHAFRGEVWDKALKYLRQTGARAAAHSANREAAVSFEKALQALQHLPSTPENTALSVDIRLDLRSCLLPLGDSGQMLAHLREAERLAEALADHSRLGWVSSYLTHYFWWRGDPDEAIKSGERALSIAESTGDLVLQVLTRFHIGQAYHSLGDYRRAMQFLAATVTPPMNNVMRERFGVLYSVRARSWMTWCFAELGQFAQGVAYGREAVQMAEAVDQPFSLITALLSLGLLYVRKGDHDQAIPLLESGLTLCRARDLPVLFPTVASRLGAAYAYSGRLSEALALLERAVDRATSMNRVSGHSLRLTHLGEAYLLAGRFKDAGEVASSAVRLAQEHKESGCRAWALRLMGEVSLSSEVGDTKEAEGAFREALTVAEALGMRPLSAHCRAGLARVCRARGMHGEAEQHLAVAMTSFRELDMPLWIQRVEAVVGRDR